MATHPTHAIEGSKRGRPPLVFDQEAALKMSAVGCSIEQIATVMGCSASYIHARKDFMEEHAKAFENVRTSLRSRQIDVAMGSPEFGQAPNTTMLIWLGKQYLGQKEQFEAPQAGNAGAVQIRVVFAESIAGRDLARHNVIEGSSAAEPRISIEVKGNGESR